MTDTDATSEVAPDPIFTTDIPTVDGSLTTLPVSPNIPLFIVGANGVGKSGLILHLFKHNREKSVRISAHRQTWMETNYIPFSPQEKVSVESTYRGTDIENRARTYEWNPGRRAGIVIADLIEADNALSRQVRTALATGNEDEARRLASGLPPLEIINQLFAGSGIPVSLSIAENSAIEASKNGSAPYSIASLSDGERAALLIAGAVLTADEGALIMIDEPERHLHPSIVAPLLIQLFSQRPDCTFVISTHELSIPICYSPSRIALVRDSVIEGDDFVNWDLDILDPGTEIDDNIREAIIGSRRKIIFIEGTRDSLDQPLYQILFPGVTIIPRATSFDVVHSVDSIRAADTLAWLEAFGIVDQDQISPERRSDYEQRGIFALNVYSVEGLYYHPMIVEAVAHRQATLIEVSAESMIDNAWRDALGALAADGDRMAARMTEQAVKDAIWSKMPDWKTIQAGADVSIAVDAKALFEAEQQKFQSLLYEKNMAGIVARYPIRETMTIVKIVSALHFKSRWQYESAVRKIIYDNLELKNRLLNYFGGLRDILS